MLVCQRGIRPLAPHPTSMSTASPPTDDDILALQWWHWPLAAHWPWSLLVPLVILSAGGAIAIVCDDWAIGTLAAATLAGSLVRFLLPTEYVVHSGGFQRIWVGRFGHHRLRAWAPVRSYQSRATGVLLYRQPNPRPLDVLRAEFLPFGNDPDELLCALREFASHAEELPPG